MQLGISIENDQIPIPYSDIVFVVRKWSLVDAILEIDTKRALCSNWDIPDGHFDGSSAFAWSIGKIFPYFLSSSGM